jgi:hypothetical protein
MQSLALPQGLEGSMAPSPLKQEAQDHLFPPEGPLLPVGWVEAGKTPGGPRPMGLWLPETFSLV